MIGATGYAECAGYDLSKEFIAAVLGSTSFGNNFKSPELAEDWLVTIFKKCDENPNNYCGDHCNWIFDEQTRTLLIKGRGEIQDLQKLGTAPWASLSKGISCIIICEGITRIGHWSFYGRSILSSLFIPYTVTKIGNNAFQSCTSLRSITIPDTVLEIGEFAFNECSSLTSVTIPNDITKIQLFSFGNCSSLASIAIPINVTTIGSNAFFHVLFLKISSHPQRCYNNRKLCIQLLLFFGIN